jgi:cytochrome b561
MTIREKIAHGVSAAVSFLLSAPDDSIAQMMSFLPGSITTHRCVGFVLALITFSRVVARAQKAKPADPAAPAVPASEADTKLEKVNPEKSK